jgi:RNA polymerase sigma factor (sigma-70 family)
VILGGQRLIDGPGGTTLTHLSRVLGGAAYAALPDADLLRRFAAGPGAAAEAAFTALVRRHGPAVLRTCRRALGHAHDAEDAFQATFLVLARRAGALRLRGALRGWLLEVARRVSAHARADAIRRQAHERRAAADRTMAAHDTDLNLTEAVRAAVRDLPEPFRGPVALCDLDGLSYREAAWRLGCSPAAVRGRLARGRQWLRVALRRAGLAPHPAAVPPALAAATARAAVGGGKDVSAAVLLLVNGGMQSMVLTKVKTAGVCALFVILLAAGAYGLNAQVPNNGTSQGSQQPGVALNHYSSSAAHSTGTATLTLTEAVPAAELIARLAQQTQKQRDAGDLDGALTTVRQLEAEARHWQTQLQQERMARENSRRNYLTAPPAGDLEGRLREVERKLDRILQALDGKPATSQSGAGTFPQRQ